MTVTSRPQYVTIPGSAVVIGVGINVPFDVQAKNELYVLYGDDVAAFLDIDYTVTLASDYRSAVVFPLSGLIDKTDGGQITIRSAIPYTQGWAVPINARLAEADLQRTTDRDVLRDRQLYEVLDHGIRTYFNNPSIVSVENRRVIQVGTPIAGDDAARFDSVQAVSARIDDILASGGTSIVRDTATVFSAAAVPEAQSPDYYRVAGRSSIGDGGSGLWKFEPDIATVAPGLKFTNGSRVFINRSSKVRPEEAGARGTGSAADAATNVTAFGAVLNSSEHSWISLDQPAVYKMNSRVARTLLNQQSLVIEMHPDAELDFSAVGDDLNPMLGIQGALGAQTLVTADVLKGAVTIPVASTVGFVVGQGAKLASNKIFDPFETLTPEAEIGIVEAIGASTITLLEPITTEYLLANVPTLKPVTFTGRTRLVGGRLRGNPAVSMHGFWARYMLGLSIEGTHFVDFDSRAIAFRDSLGGRIDGIDVYGDETPDTGYAVSMWGASRDLSVVHSDFRRCRHAFTTNNTPSEGGIPQNATVFDNRVHGTAEDGNDALDTHCAARAIRFLYNWVYDSKGHGIHAQCPDVDIIGNRVFRSGHIGISWINESSYDGRATIADNIIEDGVDRGIFCTGASHGDGSGIARLNISRNEVYRVGAEGIHVKSPTTGARSVRVDVNGNYIDGYNGTAISVETTDRFKIRDNESKNPVLDVANSIRLESCTFGYISSERHRLTNNTEPLKRGIVMLSSCNNLVISGDTLLIGSDSGATGIGISADNTCTSITVERSVRAVGFELPLVDLGTALSNHNKALLEPRVFTIDDDQVASTRFSPVTQYCLALINARSGSGSAPHGSFWARGGGTPIAVAINTSLSNIDFATGALSPGSGADGKFTISANNDSTIHFSNRLGVTLVFDLQLLTG